MGRVGKISGQQPAGRAGRYTAHAQRGAATAAQGQPVDILIAVFGIHAVDGLRIKTDIVCGIHPIITVLIKDLDSHFLTQIVNADLT